MTNTKITETASAWNLAVLIQKQMMDYLKSNNLSRSDCYELTGFIANYIIFASADHIALKSIKEISE